jgi:hypothetical protein
MSVVEVDHCGSSSASSRHCNQLLDRGIHKCDETPTSKCLQLPTVCIV